MTTREEAKTIKAVLSAAVDALQDKGFDRGQIGASIGGIGFALVQVHLGHRRAMEMLEMLRANLEADEAKRFNH